ncbi:MAG TPA: hypothetical protein VG435_14965 [Acidimicrobiales bacterium]|nr:hypothetical protein [Acidimicrobiales bacterium]
MILALFAVLVVLFVVLPLIGMALWAIVSTVIVGLILGALGRLIAPGRHPIGFLATVGAGLIGSILGGFFGQHVFHVHWFGTLLIQIAVAAVAVAMMSGRRRAEVRS